MKTAVLLLFACTVVGLTGRGVNNTPYARGSADPVAVRESKWTGTIRQETHSTWDFGSSESTVSLNFQEVLPTKDRENYTMDENYTDDKGTGNVTKHGQITLGGRTFTSECAGSGQSQLHEIAVVELNKVYSFHAMSPVCRGTDNDGQPTEEIIDVIVSDRPLLDPNVLAGTYTDETDVSGIHNVRTVTWNLRRTPIDVELIVAPTCFKSSVQNCSYDTWLPEPGRDEMSKGSVLNIALKLQGRNGRPVTKKAESFELRLVGTSQEPGVTINAPLTPGPKQLPDIRFLQPSAPESIEPDQKLTVQSPDGLTGSAKIASYDGGGYTLLIAEAILRDTGERIQGHLLVSNGETEITIPKRDRNSNIATAWRNANGNPADSYDDEDSDGNRNNGDGLSAYEEYRGVFSEGKFKRLDPQKKELGVRMKNPEFGLFAAGIDLFESATTIKPIRFDETEIGTDRRLNKNASTNHVYDQYVENLEKLAICDDANGKRLSQAEIDQLPLAKKTGDCGRVTGENQPVTVTAKLPEGSERVVIDIDKIIRLYNEQEAVARQANIRMPYTKAESIANTIAHELAHGVNVNHHGLPLVEPNKVIPEKSADIYHVFADDGATEITKDFIGQLLTDIGKAHNDESGDLSCIMAYTSMYNWVFRVGKDGSLNYYKVPLLPVGKNMCRSKNGPGPNLNAGGKYFGDAQAGPDFGNCMGQIKLRP